MNDKMCIYCKSYGDETLQCGITLCRSCLERFSERDPKTEQLPAKPEKPK
jgi:hypothetical protein